MLKDIYNYCNEVGLRLSLASVLESSIPKPGNASPLQDIETVSYKSLVISALKLLPKYREACIRGYYHKLPIMDLLYQAVDSSFSLLGTSLLLLPLAYSSSLSLDINSLLSRASQLITVMNERDWYWFSKSLSLISPSYLGRAEKMDYRKENLNMWEVLQWSATFDSISREMIKGYPLTMKVFDMISRNVCGSFYKSVQGAFVHLLSIEPDSLISRKWGHRTALEVSKIASEISICPSDNELDAFNKFLLSKKLNPGSTADIIAAGIGVYEIYELFVNGIKPPMQRRCN
ncbi:MAG: triphosphoribosyl-dephospho-CoA synthase [Metallosphaera sp.]|uniref:Triphosphoribosyl-dephospho-CoA protein n=2 Tax=Sulfolobaceae TaxID=118883 RepID=F4G1M7_METCR|nr:triphosphoribosyl-dephospho-CoA synthase [Metallosphaera cuprina]AEB96034.1 triphosphoribosyl-dephospho-CoA protein [Metallosphaera cuprina Ar-4]